MSKICTSIEQSKKLIELGIDAKTADMCFLDYNDLSIIDGVLEDTDLPAWSLSALLKLLPECILRNDKSHKYMSYVPSYRWEITPSKIYYTDGNDIMDYASFGYGRNGVELIDAVFKMICYLKENERLVN